MWRCLDGGADTPAYQFLCKVAEKQLCEEFFGVSRQSHLNPDTPALTVGDNRDDIVPTILSMVELVHNYCIPSLALVQKL